MSQYRHNGRFAKLKVVQQRENCRVGIANHRKYLHNLQNDSNRLGDVCTGNRIVDLQYLGKQLFCQTCDKTLSLTRIEKETLMGVHSVIYVRCPNCLILKPISTGQRHKVNQEAKKVMGESYHNDLTTKAVLVRT